MAIIQNVTFDLGETWIVKHTATQDGVSPFNLTNATVYLYVKSSAGVVMLGPTNQTVSFTDVTKGLSQITVTPAQQTAAAITAGVYTYLIRVTLQDGTVTDQNAGSFTVRATAAL